MLRRSVLPRPSMKSKIMRVNSTAVNMFAISPMLSVTANPLIGPVPR